ncbi:hypothetical protein ACLSZN_08985 [Avibacterium avium]|uniref:hypothetical protein n=1 Tax=Avibacterium avium TaxID=751 RepID=UPI003BF8F108
MEKEKKTTVGTFTQDPTKSIVKVQITRRIPDGVYVWIETDGFGHTFISIHKAKNIYVYSYGRYDDVDKIPLSGEGVLGNFKNDSAISFIKSELDAKNYKIYKINDVSLDKNITFFEDLWNNSNETPNNSNKKEIWKKYGKVISKYNLFYRNCTTVTIDSLKYAGTNIFNIELKDSSDNIEYRYKIEGIIAPLELGNFMETRKTSSTNISDFTSQIKSYFN